MSLIVILSNKWPTVAYPGDIAEYAKKVTDSTLQRDDYSFNYVKIRTLLILLRSLNVVKMVGDERNLYSSDGFLSKYKIKGDMSNKRVNTDYIELAPSYDSIMMYGDIAKYVERVKGQAIPDYDADNLARFDSMHLYAILLFLRRLDITVEAGLYPYIIPPSKE